MLGQFLQRHAGRTHRDQVPQHRVLFKFLISRCCRRRNQHRPLQHDVLIGGALVQRHVDGIGVFPVQHGQSIAEESQIHQKEIRLAHHPHRQSSPSSQPPSA